MMHREKKMNHFFGFYFFFSVLSHNLLSTKCLDVATAQGNIIIGGLFPIHESIEINSSRGTKTCDRLSTARLVQSLIMVQAVEEVNQKRELGNLTLGYRIHDSCADVTTALKKIQSFMRGNCNTSSSQQSPPPVLAVIGDYYSEVCIAVTRQLNLEDIPLISYGATSGILSDKTRFPSFMRTVPEDDHQVHVIINILKNNNWNWIGVVTTDGEYGRYTFERLQHHATEREICFAFTSVLPDVLNHESLKESINTTVERIMSNENVKVIVSFAKPNHMMYLFQQLLKDPRGRGKVWLASDIWSQSPEVLSINNHKLSDVGTIFGITLKSGDTTKFEQYLHNLNENPNNHENNPFLSNYLKEHGLESSEELNKRIYPYAVFSIGLAVKAVTQAIKDLCTYKDCMEESLSPLELRYALRKTSFHIDGKNYSFDQRGDLNTGYDIILWKQTSTDWLDVQYIVGHYSMDNQHMTFTSQEAKQALHSQIHTVSSRCSPSCLPGFMKTSVIGQPVCCYQCQPCNENTYSNSTDSNVCHPCELNHYSEMNSSMCMPKTIEFLEWRNYYLIVLLSVTSLGAVLTIIVGIIFLACWNTPVVRSSVGPICLLLLFSLLATFASVVLFGGKPSSVQCQSQQALFGLSFTMCVTCILVKSLKIILAFEFDPVTQSVLKKLFHPYLIIVACMAGQVAIVAVWLSSSPPKVTWKSEGISRLMYCHEKSDPLFGAMLAYIALLAIICFGVAFKGRKLPQSYNDAKFITFAMLIYFISWIIFVPVYINVKGKYLPALEMVVILISAYGILFCQFFTKCYIILCKREANTVSAFCSDVRNYSMDNNAFDDELPCNGIKNPALSMESMTNSLSSDLLTNFNTPLNSSVSTNALHPLSNPQEIMPHNNLNYNKKLLQRYASLPSSLTK